MAVEDATLLEVRVSLVVPNAAQEAVLAASYPIESDD